MRKGKKKNPLDMQRDRLYVILSLKEGKKSDHASGGPKENAHDPEKPRHTPFHERRASFAWK